MRKPFVSSSIRRLSIGASSEDGMPCVQWNVEPLPNGARPAPSHACTVIAFDEASERDARLAELVAQRDNASIHSASSPAKGGPFVVLTVHLDRLVDVGTPYGAAIAIHYHGRGLLTGTIHGGLEAWGKVINGDRAWTTECIRPIVGGFEIAGQIDGLYVWMESDLADRLVAALEFRGLRPVGGSYVSKVVPGEEAQALHRFREDLHGLGQDLEPILHAAYARQLGRLVVDDVNAQRVLRRLARGCVVFWSEGSKLTSHQLRAGDMMPYPVSGETVESLYRLGLVETLWEPAEGARFPSAHWHLLKITDTGRLFLDGDVVGGVARARRPREMPTPMRRRKAVSFPEAISTHAATLSPQDKEGLLDGISLPKSFDIAKRVQAIGAAPTLSMVLIGMLSGVADVTEDGRFKLRKA